MKSLFQKLRAYFPLIVVIGAFVWSALAIAFYRQTKGPPKGSTVIRFGHWQLEASVRDAVDAMAKKYRELHPDVWIVQDPIPDSIYGQWASTQLMGATAPDIMQVGALLPDNVWLSYYNRYFTPLGRAVNQMNPYNAGTPLEKMPMRQTYKDGMKTGYVTELQDFYSIPFSVFGCRLFYNKDLLKQLTGLDEVPHEYRAFLDCCKKISEQKTPQGQSYIPIASSGYHFGMMWDSLMFDPLTYEAFKSADFNRDGFLGNDELFVGVRTGRIDFDHPAYRAKFTMTRQVSDYFQTGWTGLGRDEAVFLFAQQKAVFIGAASWDALGLLQQAKGVFELGLMDFPRPAKDDPEFGKFAPGPPYESVGAGFRFGITRFSKHPDVALDFLMFMASQQHNEELNKIIGWIPAITGTQMDPVLAAFEPHLEGVYGALPATLGGETSVKWGQLTSAFQVKQIDFDTLAKDYSAFYKEKGLADFLEQQRGWRRGMAQGEQFLAGIRSKALATTGPESESQWVKYRALTAQRQVWGELDHSRQMKLVEKGVEPGLPGPYEFSSNVVEKIRMRLRAETFTAR
jgi:raffinose/stachyose/melibiose transport system substrate-binding protein